MKKRLWSLLLVLIMVLSMIPATAYEAATPGIGFYYAQGGPNGFTEDKTMGFHTTIGDVPGPTRQAYFYFDDGNGNTIPLQAGDLVSKNTNIIKVSPNDMDSTVTNFDIVGFGQTTLDYTVGGQTYSLNVNVTLKPVGCYSTTTASTSSFLSTFDVTNTANTFYIAVNGNYNLKGVSVQGENPSMITYVIDASEKFATVTVNGTPSANAFNNYYFFTCDLEDTSGMSSGTMKHNCMIQLLNANPKLEWCWPEFSNNVPTVPQNAQWQSEMTMWPGRCDEVFLRTVTAGVAGATITNVTSSNSSVVRVEKQVDLVKIEAVGLGTADIIYTDGNNNTYTMPVVVDLPQVAAYTSKTPSGNTLITDGFTVNAIGDEFYVIARNGYTFDYVNLVGDLNDCATVTLDSTKTIATVKIVSKPISFKTGQFIIEHSASTPQGWHDDGTLWMQLINGMPHIEYIYVDDTRYEEYDCLDPSKPDTVFEGWINFYPITSGPSVVSLADIKSTDESVVKISSANDPQNPDKVSIEIVGWGSAQIVYTDANGKEYALDVIVDFDNLCEGLFTDDNFKVEHLILADHAVTNEENVIYLMSRYNWKISNVELLNDAKNYATVKVINNQCIEITLSDKINDYIAYGDTDYFELEFDEIGDHETFRSWAGFSITNKICDHPSTELVGSKAPTCTVNGNTGAVVCKQCERVVVADNVIAATGHSYVDGKCKDCGDKPVVADKVDKVDTTKPVQEVTPVIEQEALETTTKEITSIVDAILADKVTDEVKKAVSEETIKEIKKELEAGKQIKTEVVAAPIEEKDIDEEVVKEIKAELGESGKVAQFLDLSVLIKSVAVDGSEKELGTLNVLSEKIKFTIMVPEDLVKEGREFYIIRVHDGEADKLDLTKNSDGTYSFETDRFSSYALAYDEVDTSATQDSTDTQDATAPKTGDNTNVAGYMLLLAVAFIALAFAKRNGLVLK